MADDFFNTIYITLIQYFSNKNVPYLCHIPI